MPDLAPAPASPSLARRTVLVAAPITAVALGAAACGGNDSNAPASDAPAADTSSGTALTPTAKVPVGGGVVVGDVVVTQPVAGTFEAFSTTCPHMGCAVAPKDGDLVCPCHGSEFGLDGSLVQGPATTGLTPVRVQVRDADVVRA
ncbi:Rieske (2Fe-2S) protein [Gordonia humi]|uniref:Cytochrome bc1 complex Rieske iron-sulfur subunit n=1 Tax=Gordonia humi TaxID=686429 RepID=A0A840F9D7_9ACTN|nr:Rieske (2Fe-2S) protein [Gordonia humi]MBB4136780.1 Rieske Fe-S protein [Gordonia humi]